MQTATIEALSPMDVMITFADLPRPAPKPIHKATRLADLPYPADAGTVRFIVRSQPNASGRQDFWVLKRCAEGRPVFFSFANHDLRRHEKRARDEGAVVEVIEMVTRDWQQVA